MSLHLIGDVHGKIPQYLSITKRLDAQGHKSIQIGDMGVGFPDVRLPKLTGHRFIAGNHDSPEACRAHPNFLWDYGVHFYLDPSGQLASLFYCGGAMSIDKDLRIEGVSWWRDEELSGESFRMAYDLYCETKPKVVVTHDCPTAALLHIIPEKVGSNRWEYSATNSALQGMLEAHQPARWYFGHHHIPKTFTLYANNKPVIFQCLGELEVAEIPVVS